MRRGRSRIALVVLVASCAVARAGGAQDVTCDRGDIEVAKLSFEGNRAFSDAVLSRAIATTASSRGYRWSGFLGTKRCLDRAEIPRDRLRLIIFYRNHGFPRVSVDTLLQQRGMGELEVLFRIDEGRPLRLESLVVTGLSGVADSARVMRNLPLRVGARFERPRLEAARDTIARRLRNSGYPNADVLRSFETDTQRLTATVQLDVAPGELARLGTVRVEVTPLPGNAREIEPRVVRSMLGLRTGALYRERDLVNAQRNLYQTDAFPYVKLSLDSTRAVADSVIDLLVEVTEGRMHLARVGAGYGTLDCLRAVGEYTDRNALEWLSFPSGIRRFEVTGRLSKIGIGDPLDGARDLCPQIKSDPYSAKLNYFGSATIRQPVLFGLRTVPTLTVYSERRSEYKAYLRTTAIGGVTSITYQRNPRFPVTLAYQLEYGRTDATAALFCAVFNICELAARENLQRTQRQAVASVSVIRDRTDRPLNPTRGSLLRFGARHASELIYSNPDAEFNQLTGDARWFRQIGSGVVLAGRVRAGGVFGGRFSLRETGEFIPPQERLYAGGETTVRGFRQNELGPIIYLARDTISKDTVLASGETVQLIRADSNAVQRAIPAGGNSVVVGNVELRLRSPFFPDLLQFTLFTDVGEVWNRGADDLNLNFRQLKWTPGVGFRVFSPVGAIRVDVGYNPYQRQSGPAYFDQPLAEGGNLYCASPTNTLPVRNGVQDEGVCPGTFRPPPRDRFIQRINLNFSIGQAF